MFEGVSEIAGRVAQLQSALDSYSSQPSASSSAIGSSFQQTLADAQGAPGSGGFLSPNPVSSAQLSGQPVSVNSSGGDQLPPSASMLGSAGGSGLAGLTGGSGASGLAGLLGGSGSGASDLSGLLGGSGSSSSGLAGLLGNSSSGLGSLTGLAGTGGASSLAGLAGLAGGSGNSSGLAELAGLGGAQDTSGLAALLGGGSGGLAGLPPGTTPANLAALASLQAESGDIGLLDPSSSDDSSSDPSSSNLSGLAGLLGSGSQSMAPQQAPAVQNLVGQIAQSQGVNPALAEAVAKSESGFNPQAVSPAGAQGVMQLMPSTFQQYAQQASTASAPAGLPVQGAKLSQPFGPTSETMEPPLDWNGAHYAHFHTGVDLAVAQGTPIRATMAGTIQVRSDPSGFGNLIVLENGPWDVLLGHTSSHPSNIQTGTVVQ
ncbi:MAG TPA: transglycosylase SLT domain-containing protein, partial [Chloroflexota bacterium]|nr:transglycosylase SLT domain-containing protein [Chloroflexota bacterium]